MHLIDREHKVGFYWFRNRMDFLMSSSIWCNYIFKFTFYLIIFSSNALTAYNAKQTALVNIILTAAKNL